MSLYKISQFITNVQTKTNFSALLPESGYGKMKYKVLQKPLGGVTIWNGEMLL